MFKTINYNNGYYKGEVDERGRRHGEGTYYWGDGSFIRGKWYEDKAVSGKYVWPNGTYYEGTVEDNGKKISVTGKGTTYFKSGAIYEGYHRDSFEDGKGTMYYTDGAVYKGHWEKGNFYGNGKLTFYEGICYIGFFDFRDNKLEFRGKKIMPSGSYYEGTFINRSLEGFAKYYNAFKELIYEGEYKNNKRNGHGKAYYSDGSFYVGEWKDNKKHGKGVLQRMDGSAIEGTWKNDLYDGRMVIKNLLTLKKYTCDYKDGVLIETVKVTNLKLKGNYETQKLTLKDKKEYEGHVLNGKPHGRGVCYDKSYNSTHKYEGSFKKGKFTGYGSYVADDSEYVGQFKNYMRHGIGVQYYSNGKAEVCGNFKNDELYGRCSFYNFYPGIAFMEGIYKRDHFVGKVYVEYENGNTYVGKLKNYLPVGKGVIVYADDSYIVGSFKNGKLHGKAIKFANNKMYKTEYKNGKCIMEFETKNIIKK